MTTMHRFRAGILALLLGVSASGPASADDEQSCRSSQARLSIPACTRLLATPDLPAARRMSYLTALARAQVDVRTFPGAEKSIEEMFKLEPNSAAALSARGRLRQAQGRADQARIDFDRGVAAAPNAAAPLVDRGTFFLQSGNTTAARADFDAAIQRERDKAAAYVGRAQVLRRAGEDRAALADLDTAARLEPNHAETFIERGEVRQKLGDAAGARADYDRADRLAPGNARVQRGRTAVALALGKPSGNSAGAAAERSAQPLPPMAPPPPVEAPAPSVAAPAPSAPAPSATAPARPAPSAGTPRSRGPGGALESAAPKPAEADLWDVVPVFYGTDRKRGDSSKRLTFVAERAGRLDLGRADITVPKAHQVPNVERPFAIRVPFTSITLYESKEDRSKHFTIKEIKGLTREQFLAEVRAKLATSRAFKDRAVVFIHGYNTDFDFALYRTAQMAYDLKFDGAPFLYSWPSASGITGYVSDRDSAEQAEPYLRQFLELVINETGAKSVSLIAHSMGNLPLLRVLKDIEPKLPSGVKLDQVILAAPDVDRALFEQLASGLTKVGRGVTLYASSKDRAMTAARLVAGGTRAGDVPPGGPVIMDGMDTIDVSSTTMDSLALGHSLYAERNAIINDIALLLQTGERPPHKRIPILVRVPTAKGEYWRYP